MAMTLKILVFLKVLMILISSCWVCLWILKPTKFWTKSWHKAEDKASNTFFGYNGLNFAVFVFPVIAVAMIGFIYLHLHGKVQKTRQKRFSISNLSTPVIVHRSLGVISLGELLISALFLLFLAWTFYARVSNDFKKMIPVKSMKLNSWQLKIMRSGIRFGSLAEACLALLLLPVPRGLAIFRILGYQFEASIKYHVWLGTSMIFFSVLHSLCILFIWGLKNRLVDELRQWQKKGRVYLAGEIALATGLIIWITSLPQIRRRKFEIFYYTHHLYTIFIIFFLLHAGDRHFYMVFAGVLLFALDKLLRIIQSRSETCLLSAKIYPCKAIELVLTKHPRLKYTPTSVIFINIPSISKLQWHPFSIISSSSVDEGTLSVIMKCEGWWTSSLSNIIYTALDFEKSLPVAIEGPYGPSSMDFLRYDSVIMVAGGIGITPFLSILQEVYSVQNKGKKLPMRIQLIYVVKNSHDISLLTPISRLILNHSEDREHLKLKIFVTQEERFSTSVRELLNDLSQVQTVNFNTKGSNYTIFGIESLLWMAAISGFSSIVFIVSQGFLNLGYIHPERKSSEKIPSSVTDLLLVCSFVIATSCSILATAIMRWRKMKREIPHVSESMIQTKGTEVSSIEGKGIVEEHELHFGKRPNLQDILGTIPIQNGGSEIGVFVCGPESMKESVALFCRRNSRSAAMNGKGRKPYFSFHPLNFAL